MRGLEDVDVVFLDGRVRLIVDGEARECSEQEHERWVIDGADPVELFAGLSGSVAMPEPEPEDDEERPALPLCFGEHFLLRPIGRGCFGDVFEAWDPVCGERVAIKVLHRLDAWSLRAFRNEFRRLVSFADPRLVTPEELIVVRSRSALVMRLIGGREVDVVLREAAGEAGPIADDLRLRRIVLELVKILAVLERGGLIHMDLKPGNVRVGAQGVYLLDFGLTRLRRAGRPEAEVVGAPLYMAPEQLMRRTLTIAVDHYALGVLLYTAIAGKHPFEAFAPNRVFARLDEPAPPLASSRPEVGPLWGPLVDCLLATDVSRRLGTEELLALLGAEPEITPVLPAMIGREREVGVLRRSWEQVLAGVASLVMVGGEPGIGKSSLVRGFTDGLTGDDAAVVWAPCYESEATPYKTVDVLVEGLVELVVPDVASYRDVLDHPSVVRLAAVAPALAGHVRGEGADDEDEEEDEGEEEEEKEEKEEEKGGESRERRGGRGDGLAMLVGALAERSPLVLVIDDAQWGDADSADLLAPLLASPTLRRVMIVLIRRSQQWESSPFGLALESQIGKGLPFEVSRMDVGRLGLADGRALIASRAAAEVDEAHMRRVLEFAGGSPYLLEVYASLLADGLELPRGGDVIEHRLVRLCADERRFVETVAVAGAPLELASVVAASAVPAPSRELLRRLRAERVLALDHRTGRRRVSIAHGLIQEALLEALEPALVRRLESSLADTLLAAGAHEPGRIAHYLHRAGRRSEARTFGLLGAAQAEAAGAYAQVAELLGLVLDGGCEPSARRELELRRAQALAAAGRGVAAGELYMALAEATSDRAESRELRRCAVESWTTVGEVERGLEVLRPLMRELGLPPLRRGLLGLPALVVRLVRLMIGARRVGLAAVEDRQAAERADTYWVAIKGLIFVETSLAMNLMIDGLRHAAASGSRLRLGRAMGLVAAFLGDFPGLRGCTQTWIETIELWSREEPYLAATLPLWRSFRAHARCELATGRREGLRALELLQTVGEASWERVQAASSAARAMRNQGDFVACAELSRAQLRRAERSGDLYAQVLFRLVPLMPVVARGGLREARIAREWISSRWHPGRYTVQSFYVMIEEGTARLYEGDPEAAYELWSRGRGAYLRSGGDQVSFSRIERRVFEGRVGFALGGQHRGLTPLRKLIAQLRGEKTADAVGNGELFAAAFALRRGRRSEAEAALERAIASFDAGGIMMEGEAARLRLAQLRGVAKASREALDRMRRLGAREPERWAAVVAPGFPGAYLSSSR